VGGKRAREQLALVRKSYADWQRENRIHTDPRQFDLSISATQQELVELAQTITEAEIDDAVMHNRVKPADAARVRTALRNRHQAELQR
jgi:hypothetical protein